MRVAVIGLLLVVIAGLVLVLVTPDRGADGASIGDFRGWRPRAHEIAADLRRHPGLTEDQRLQRFAELVTRRFRDQHVAVKVEAARHDRLNVLCAAAIPRWEIARIAVTATAEAERLFGRPFGADIFESYIHRPRVKVAELTPGPPRARIVFDPAFDADTAPAPRPPSRPAPPGTPLGALSGPGDRAAPVTRP